MSLKDAREVWLRGPVPEVPPLLQPIAHALLQAVEEIEEMFRLFPEEKLWDKPAGVASPGFHLQHISGVLDRLFTYANGHLLNETQLHYLSLEGKAEAGIKTEDLIVKLKEQVEKSIEQLKIADVSQLTAVRGVGRAQLPSTVIGLMTHAAEHTMRHLGQLVVTVKFLSGSK